MTAIVFQGGGAKGSYEAGAVKALLENGYKFDCAAGTSIGSVNAAIVAQGDADKLCDMWNKLDFSDLYDDNKYTRLLSDDEITIKETLILAKLALDGGLNMEKAKRFLSGIISEERIRLSPVDFGLMTVNVSEGRLIPTPMFKNQIPEGKLLEYVFASADFPLFPQHVIDGKTYVDGGFFDNLPVNMVLDRGYDDVVAISLGENIAPKKGVKKEDASKVRFFEPSEKLTNAVLNFSHERLVYMSNLGYLDTMRSLGKLAGETYYIEKMSEVDMENALNNSPIKQKIFDMLGVSDANECFGKLCMMLFKPNFFSVLVHYLEYTASKLGIDRYTPYDVYTLSEKCMEALKLTDKIIPNTPKFKIAKTLCEIFSDAKRR